MTSLTQRLTGDPIAFWVERAQWRQKETATMSEPLHSNAYKMVHQHRTIDLGLRYCLRRLGVLINRLGKQCTAKLNAWAFDRCFVCENRPRRGWLSLTWKTSWCDLFLAVNEWKSAKGVLGFRIQYSKSENSDFPFTLYKKRWSRLKGNWQDQIEKCWQKYSKIWVQT